MIDFDCQCNRIGGLPFLPCGGADTAGIVSQLTATCMPAEQCATIMRTSVRLPPPDFVRLPPPDFVPAVLVNRPCWFSPLKTRSRACCRVPGPPRRRHALAEPDRCTGPR